MKIAIFGLGYVGTVTALGMAKLGHDVVGVDVAASKIDLLNQGICHIVEKDLQQTMDAIKADGKFTATLDPKVALDGANMSFICVGTPSDKRSGKVEGGAVKHVIDEIIATKKVVEKNDKKHPIVVRSTLFPDEFEQTLAAVLSDSDVNGKSQCFEIVIHPEFLREGTALEDFFDPPMVVLGCESVAVADAIFSLYKNIKAPRFHVDIRTASLLKYACNSYHALKVGFANEIGRVAKEMKGDIPKLVEMFLMDKKLNISEAYLRPGMSFGGSCLPKDLKALTASCREKHLIIPILNAVLQSNQVHTNYMLEQIMDMNCKHLLILGLTFKVGTDDLRESPAVELVERLLGKGYGIKIWDPDLDKMKLVGQNKDYVINCIPHLSQLLIEDPVQDGYRPDGVVKTKPHPSFQAYLDNLPSEIQLLDLTKVDG